MLKVVSLKKRKIFQESFPPVSDPVLEFLRKFCIGLAAGTLASCFNIPFDVAKSRHDVVLVAFLPLSLKSTFFL